MIELSLLLMPKLPGFSDLDIIRSRLEKIANNFNGQLTYLCHDPRIDVYTASIRLPEISAPKIEQVIIDLNGNYNVIRQK